MWQMVSVTWKQWAMYTSTYLVYGPAMHGILVQRLVDIKYEISVEMLLPGIAL